MDAAETRTATSVQTPAKIRTGVGSLEPEPEPAMADSEDVWTERADNNKQIQIKCHYIVAKLPKYPSHSLDITGLLKPRNNTSAS